MARPSDREYQLKRKVKELEEKISTLEIENKRLKQQVEKLQAPAVDNPKKKKAVTTKKECPDCGAEIKSTELPHAILELCSKGCGHRNVRNK